MQEQQQSQQAQQAQAAQANTESATAIEVEKRKTLVLEYALKGELEDKKGAWGVEEQKARAGGVLDQESLVAIKEVFMQVMSQQHDMNMANGGANPGATQPAGQMASGLQPPPPGQPQQAPQAALQPA
jgi:hypothetical protein